MKRPRLPTAQSDHIEVRHQTVDNPLYSRAHAGEKWNHPKIQVAVNIRESAIATLAARGHLNEAQVAAATRFRGLWEDIGGAGAGAFDYTKEFVDGGPKREAISERQVIAGQELHRCRVLLGLRGYTLVSRVCGEGQALSEIASIKREKLAAAENLRGLLDDLAEMWGLKMKERKKR